MAEKKRARKTETVLERNPFLCSSLDGVVDAKEWKIERSSVQFYPTHIC